MHYQLRTADYGEDNVTDMHMAMIDEAIVRLQDEGSADSRTCQTLEAAVLSAYDSCNLLNVQHLRAPHAVDIAACAVSIATRPLPSARHGGCPVAGTPTPLGHRCS